MTERLNNNKMHTHIRASYKKTEIRVRVDRVRGIGTQQ